MEDKLIENPEEIKLTEQHEIEAIMGNPPGWLIRYGNWIFFAAIAIILSISWFLPYPDVIEAPVKIMSDTPPIRLVPRQSGQLIFLEEADGELVYEGELLAVIDNSANWQDVLALEDFFEEELKSKEVNDLRAKTIPRNLNLGDLQPFYADFINQLNLSKFNKKNNQTRLEVGSIRNQMSDAQAGIRNLNQEIVIANQSLRQLQRDENRNRQLFNEGIVSASAFEKIQNARIEKEQEIQRIKNGKSTFELRINELKRQIYDLKGRRSLEENREELNAVSTFETLRGKIDQWKKNFLIYASIEGRLSIPNQLTVNQFVERGEEIMTIIPQLQNIYGLAALGQQNIGKIALRDSVKIRMAGFPYYEFGAIEGNIEDISSLPENQQYSIKIAFPEGHFTQKNDTLMMKTTYKNPIPIRQEMEGVARIITQQDSYLGRIINRLRAVIEG